MNDLKNFDFVIYGATGFTGRLVVEYALKQYSNTEDISWAIAGRNTEKLDDLKIDRIEVASARVSEGELNSVKQITDWAKKNKKIEL